MSICVENFLFTVHQCFYINVKISLVVTVLKSISKWSKTFLKLRKLSLEYASNPLQSIMTKRCVIFLPQS